MTATPIHPSDATPSPSLTPSAEAVDQQHAQNRIFSALRQRQHQMQAKLAQASDTPQVLQIATEFVQKNLGASRVLVLQFQSPQQGRVIAEASERGWTPTLQENFPATFLGLDSQADYGREGTAILAYSAETPITPYQLQLLEKHQVRSSLTTVIRLSDQIWGLLAVQQCDRARQWSAAEILELESVSQQITITLSGHEWQMELQGQQVRDRAVVKVIDRIRRSLDLKTIFRTTAQELRQLLSADRVVLYRFNADWSGTYVAESVGGGWVSLLQSPPDEALRKGNSQDCNLQQMAERPGDVSDTYLQQTQGGTYASGEQYRIVSDIYAQGFPACYLELLEQMQAKAYLTVGVYQGEKLWGLLATYQCSAPRSWSNADVRLVGQIADQLGVALQQALILRQQRQQAERFEQAVERERAIAAVNEQIVASQSPDRIFRITTDSARQLLTADRVAIYRFNPDWSGTFIAESVGSDWRSLLRDQVVDERILQGTQANIDTEGCTIRDLQVRQLASQDTYLRDTKGGRYAKGEAARVCDDVYNAGFPDCYVQLLESFQARAYITVPIFLGEKLWGLMAGYQCSGVRHWEPEEVQLMINLSSQLSLALQRAADAEAVQKERQKLEQAIEREKAIAVISDNIKDTVNINSIFRITTQSARQLLAADRVVIYRFDPDWSGVFVSESVEPGWVSLMGKQGEDPALLEDAQSNIDTVGCTIKNLRTRQLVAQDTYLQETQGGVYRQGEAYRICNDVAKSGFPDCYLDLLASFQAQAYVTVPIFLKERLWGLMACYQCSGPRTWMTDETQLMVRLSSQLGLALQRAADFEAVKAQTQKLEQAVDRERAIAQLSNKIRQSQNVKNIFQGTVRDTRLLLQADRVVIYRFNPDWSGEFVAESVLPPWEALLNAQVDDPRLLERTQLNIDTDGCTIKQMQLRQLAAQDTYMQETQGGSYRQGEAFRVCDDIYAAGFSRCYLELLEAMQVHAYITVPIFLGDRLWGLMACYQCAEARDWEPSEVQVIVQLSSQLGIALQRAADLSQLRQQSEDLEAAATREKAARKLLQKRAIELLSAVRPALDGDLTVRAPVTEDELGTIADVYNNTLQSLRAIVQQVQTVTQRVESTSQSNDRQIRQLATRSQQQSQELGQALNEVQNVVISAQAVESNAIAIEQAVQNANTTVQEGDAAMNRTVEGILTIRDTVSEASQKIRELSESSQKIDRVVNLIGDFATQTQLLSLNAAIEATRAGEYGKGFAVVADEVRSLARQSAGASSEISNLVAEIRQQTSEVINVTEAAIAQVSAGTSLVEETKATLTAIAVATTQISTLVQSITNATSTQLDQSQVVTQAMREVTEIFGQTSRESKQLSKAFQDTLSTTQQLQAVVNQFKVD